MCRVTVVDRITSLNKPHGVYLQQRIKVPHFHHCQNWKEGRGGEGGGNL